MERNSLNLCKSARKGRLGGAVCSPVSGSSDLGVVKEDAEVSAPYYSCSALAKEIAVFKRQVLYWEALQLKEQRLEW